MSKSKGKPSIFYGWVIVTAGMLIMATSIGIVNNCFGLLIVPACRELDFTRTQMAGNQTMLNLGAMIIAVLSGRLINRRNLKRWMCLGSVLMCAFYAAFALIRTLPGFFVVALATGLAQGFINVIPLSLLISNWFVDKRGLALGLTYMGSGLGGMVFSAIGGWLLESISWRQLVLIYDLILCTVILPCVFLLIKSEPADMGLEPLGCDRSHPPRPIAPRRPAGATYLKDPHFYILALDIVITGLAVNGYASTMTPYYTDILGSMSTGALLTSGFMASLALGKLGLGWIYDKLGVLRATIVTRLALLASLLSLCMGKNIAFIALFVCTSGVAAATNSVSIPFLAESVAAESEKASVTGIYSGFQSLGSLVAPLFCGMICTSVGTYAPAYRFLALGVMLLLFPFLLTLRNAVASEAGWRDK